MNEGTQLVLTRLEGGRVVLQDAAGNVYDCATAQQLWDDVHAIHRDAEVPPIETKRATGTDGGFPTDPEEMYQAAAAEVERMAAEGYGPLAGQAVSHVMRNGGKSVHSFLRRMSRKGPRRR